MQTVIQLLSLGMGFFLAFFLLMITKRYKYFVLDVIFIGFLLTTYEWISGNTIRIGMMGIQVGVIDFLCLYLLVCSFLFYGNKRMDKRLSLLWTIVMGIFCIGIVRGLIKNPFNLVMEDIRRLIWAFIVPVLCLSRMPFSFDDTRTVRKITRYSNVIFAFCFVCWFIDIVFGIHLVAAQSDAQTTMRVLRPEQTLVLAMFAIKSIYDDINTQTKKISKRSLLYIAIVVLLQHRSAWAALAVGIVYLFIIASIDNGKAKRLFQSKKFFFQFCGIIICLIALFVALRNTNIVNQLLTGLQGITGDEGTTLDYRQRLWFAHFESLSPLEWIIGKPYGSGYFISLGSYAREITPHNAYIHTIIRNGLIGIVFVVLFLISVLRMARKVHFGAGEAICVMFLVFFYAYTYNFYTAVVFGCVIQTITNRIKEG